MTAHIETEDDRSWLRLSCPTCHGWLGVPGEVPRGHRAERVARRIDAFVHRHTSCERGQ